MRSSRRRSGIPRTAVAHAARTGAVAACSHSMTFKDGNKLKSGHKRNEVSRQPERTTA